jgi:hypothetical protein
MFPFLNRLLDRHWFITLSFMAFFGACFGLTTYNLYQLLSANLSFIREHGTMALIEGGAWQFLELTVYIYLSTIFIVLFKVCEYILVQRVMKAKTVSS